MPIQPELRLTLTLSSGASLGAYEAGAVAALLTAVRSLRAGGVPVSVDTISAASAGALVGLTAARLRLARPAVHAAAVPVRGVSS